MTLLTAATAVAAPRQLSPTDLRVMAAGCIASGRNPGNVPPSVIAAFALVESSGINQPPYQDGKTQAFGLYGYHIDRWLEHGGKREEWGVASPMRQTEVFLCGINRYYFNAATHHARNRSVWAAVAHNQGHGSDELTAYAKKIMAAIEAVETN
jgi:hypothetical protein